VTAFIAVATKAQPRLYALGGCGSTVAALDAIPARLDTRLLFPSPNPTRVSYLHLENFRRRDWKPALEGAGVPYRRIYDLRSTFASHALAAGISAFELARIMGTSVRMIEAHYGALLQGSAQAMSNRLDALDNRVQEEEDAADATT
jgi:integrase